MSNQPSGQGSAGNVLASLASFFIPGLGQLIQGRLIPAILFFVFTGLLWLVLLGWIIHLWACLDAALWKTIDKEDKQIICPNSNCGYHGPPKIEARGNFGIAFVLCLFFLLPGIIYIILWSGYRYYCPKCGMQIANDN